MIKKMLALFLSLALSVGSLFACAPKEDISSEKEKVAPNGIPIFEKVYHDIPKEDPYLPDLIYVSMQPYVFEKEEYTAADFPDIGCEAVHLSAVLKIRHPDSGKEYPYRELILELSESAKKNSLQAIRTLELREDVMKVEGVDTIPTIQVPSGTTRI